MKQAPTYIKTYYSSLTYIVLLLVLWTGFAFIEHQLDTDKHQHGSHHCQLFSDMLHGASYALPSIPLLIQKPLVEMFYTLTSVSRMQPGRKARSPPMN